jgi:beta-glucosidase
MPAPAPAFPEGFLWGAATSAYQVEGSPLADGAGPSTWHRFTHTPGNVTNGDTGDVACDHWRRWPEDVRWMRRMGLNAYRLSVSWSRVMPEGRGPVNPAGLDGYARLVDALLAAGITPMVTLYHWDLPAALDDRGGWCNPDIENWFGDYAAVLFEALGDRVPLWATINEPWVIVDGGYLHGALAPGHRSPFEAPRAAHHVLLAHGAAVRAFRAARGTAGRIGIVINLEPKDPASPAPEDAAATARADAQMNRHYLDGLFLGRYPDELPGIYGEGWPAAGFPPGDFARIAAPIDFVGINYYARALTADDPEGWPTRSRKVMNPDAEVSDLDWEIHPAGLTRALKWVRERYTALPLYVTENGIALPEPSALPPGLGRFDDPRRVAYLRSHVSAVRDAMMDGVDVRGYFAWSLLDNLEWGHGFSKRFGVLHVDHATQVRTPKSSASFLRALAVTNGAALDDEGAAAQHLPEA